MRRAGTCGFFERILKSADLIFDLIGFDFPFRFKLDILVRVVEGEVLLDFVLLDSGSLWFIRGLNRFSLRGGLFFKLLLLRRVRDA